MLTIGASLGQRFELHRAHGADAEGEDFLARRLDEPGYARIRVLVTDDALRAAAGSAEAFIARIAALDLPGIARPLEAGLHAATGQVWFAEAWTNGNPRCVPNAWNWERAREALLDAAARLEPARARGLVHGRLTPASLLDNLGTTTVIGLAAGAWLGEVRPAAPGGDLGLAARAIRALVTAPPPAFLAWVDRCEQAQFESLTEALAAMPDPERRRADIDLELRRADADERERQRQESARQWREARDAKIRAGLVAPDDLPERSEASWPEVFERVQRVLGAAPVQLDEHSASGHGLTWRLRPTYVASAWPQARGVVRALQVLARAGATLGAKASPPADARDLVQDATPAEGALLHEVAVRVPLTWVASPRSYGTREWEDGRQHGGADLSPSVLRGLVGGPRIAASRGHLSVGPVVLGWPTSHMQGPVLSSAGGMRLADLPRDPAAAAEIIAALLDAAAAVDLSELTRTSTCRFCAGQFASVDRHDATCCHRCAERHLGVIH